MNKSNCAKRAVFALSLAAIAVPSFATDPDYTINFGTIATTLGTAFAAAILVIVPAAFGIWAVPKVIKLGLKLWTRIAG